MAGEIGQYLQGALHMSVLGVALDIGVELGGGEAAADHVAFQLGHVHAIGREASQSLVQSRRNVSDTEDEGGDHILGTAGQVGLARHHQKARGVVGLIFDMAGEHVQTVDFGRKLGRQRPFGLVAQGCNLSGGGGIVVPVHRGKVMRLDESPRLTVQDRHGADPLHILDPGPFDGQKVHMHPHEGLVDDEQPTAWQQGMHVGNPAIGGVFNRQHAQFGITPAHGIDHILKGGAGQCLHLGTSLNAGLMHVGPRLALKGNTAQLGVILGHFPRLRQKNAPLEALRSATTPCTCPGEAGR
jgi:hypothetical protein